MNFLEEPIKGVLDELLKDRTTGKNITIDGAPLMDASSVVPRTEKPVEIQKDRTKKKAEVFTPTWLCAYMADMLDEEYFGRPEVFTRRTEREETVRKKTKTVYGWEAIPGKIDVKDWKDYVLRTGLEITCGEAPFVVSRYDTTTGEAIPIGNRVGILDRKLRIINENTTTKDEWYEWVYKAFQSVYGYEWAGDSLLIARGNLLLTFVEYAQDRWGETPDDLSRIVDIIVWNFWQMDGLKGCLPGDESVQCLIRNWKTGETLAYKDFMGG